MNKIERIDHDIKALIGNPGIEDPAGVAQWYVDIEKVRFRLAVTGGSEHIAIAFYDEGKEYDTVDFVIETSEFINNGSVVASIKREDIENGNVRVDVFI